MKLVFRPMWGLTIAVAICLVILITLGTWQYQRLQWKTAVIASIDSAANAPAVQNLSQLDDIVAQGQPYDFRKIVLDGEFTAPTINQGEPFHYLRSTGKAMTWRLYQPFSDGTGAAYVASHEFTDTQKDSPPKILMGQRRLIGYVRKVQTPNWTIPASTIASNRWFAFNPMPEILDWTDGGKIADAYYIDRIETADTVDDLPVQIPEIANNHLDYMLTWYSFAIILIVIYLILHKRSGRLSIRAG